MRRILLPVSALLATTLVLLVAQFSLGAEIPDDLSALAREAVSENPAVASEAITQLRLRGPEGLEALFATHAQTIAKHRAAAAALAKADVLEQSRVKSDDPAWQRLRAALDQVGGQRDCCASRLFWYTDFDDALAAARREHKPILSLRLLGKLTDEYSCANSRFFRAVLYANEEVSRRLRDRFILHWQSERPVPRITIDFGDGRKIERTVTGNSIHYVLDSEGRLIDALPGLYGPKTFIGQLERDAEVAIQSADLPQAERDRFLSEYHRQRAAEIQTAWQADLAKLGIKLAPESPGSADAVWSEAASDAAWQKIADLHADDGTLDKASVALVASQHPTAWAAGRLAMSKRVVESPMLRMLRTFQGSIALDTVRNEYLMHSQIHAWLAAEPSPDLRLFNSRVYADLFLTPDNDPWLGLMPGDIYTGLENNGVVEKP